MRPGNDEASAGDTARGFRDQGQDNRSDCAEACAQRKQFATLRARLALEGWSLSEADRAATFHATRWGMFRELPDLAAVEAFARQVGAPS